MIKFYLKFQNNMLIKNLLYIVAGVVLAANVLIRLMPSKFIHLSLNPAENIPYELYKYCDVYLLMLFIILIFFFIGTDFNNSMEEISLVIGGSSSNKFMIRKLGSLLIFYIVLYVISFINIYTLYLSQSTSENRLIPLIEIVFCSLVTNIFVISLGLFLLFLFRDIAISTSIISTFYLVEEALWRGHIAKTKGILGHIYRYTDYQKGELLRVKACYIIVSIILLLITYKMSQRKISYKIFNKRVKME